MYRDVRLCVMIICDINFLIIGCNVSKCCVYRKVVNSEVRFVFICSVIDKIMIKKENYKLFFVMFLVC